MIYNGVTFESEVKSVIKKSSMEKIYYILSNPLSFAVAYFLGKLGGGFSSLVFFLLAFLLPQMAKEVEFFMSASKTSSYEEEFQRRLKKNVKKRMKKIRWESYKKDFKKYIKKYGWLKGIKRFVVFVYREIVLKEEMENTLKEMNVKVKKVPDYSEDELYTMVDKQLDQKVKDVFFEGNDIIKELDKPSEKGRKKEFEKIKNKI